MSSNPKIETLVEDIYGVFDKQVQADPEAVTRFGEELAKVVTDQISEQKQPHLRLSNLGTPCKRKLWYSINTPELAEKLPGAARIKFIIGHVTEAVVLFLAKLSGHKVEREQETVDLHGVKGHLDAFIDDELVDVKSASPYSFSKFKDGLKPEQDAFGYLTQLGSYGAATGNSRAHFLAVDKVLGKLALDTHEFPEVNHEAKVAAAREILGQPTPPERGYEDEADGASGNRKLGTACSYCDFKTTCWPGVQTFAYSNGPRFLTRVVRPPKVDRVES